MSAGQVGSNGKQSEKDWDAFKAKSLACVGHLQRSLSETTPGAVARRTSIHEHDMTQVLRDLREAGLIVVHRRTDNGVAQYHVTAKGWDKLGQQPPIWAAA